MVCAELLVDIPSRDLQDIYGDTERQISQRILLSDAENIQDSSEFRNDLQGQRMGQSSSDDHKIQQRIHRRRRIEKLQDDIIFKSVELIEEQPTEVYVRRVEHGLKRSNKNAVDALDGTIEVRIRACDYADERKLRRGGTTYTITGSKGHGRWVDLTCRERGADRG